MAKRKPKNTWVLIVGAVVVVLLVVGTITLDPIAFPVNGLVRAAAVTGYICIFLAVVSSNYMRELTKFFGRPFIRVHHIASLTALSALVIHAVTVAWSWKMPAIFIPSMDMPQALAFWLLAMAALSAFFRKTIGKRWKYVHWINYLVFLLGTIHAQALGANFQHLGIRIISIVMALIVVFLFVWKRTAKRRRRSKK
jgi:DMSO/TMAO reductase YedYZ heme-binding membrane subunit